MKTPHLIESSPYMSDMKFTKSLSIYNPPKPPTPIKINSTLQDDFVPTHIKNQQLADRVRASEASMETTIAAHAAQAAHNIKTYHKFLQNTETLSTLPLDLEENYAETTEIFAAEIAKKNDNVTRLKLIHDLKKSNFEAYYPLWLKCINDVFSVIKELGYNNRTGWRSQVNGLLRKAANLFQSKNGHNHAIIGEFRRISISFNAYGSVELRHQLNKLIDEAGDLEGHLDPTFQLLRLEHRIAKENWETERDFSNTRKQKVKEREERKKELLSESIRARGELGEFELGLGLSLGDPSSVAVATEATTTTTTTTTEALRIARLTPITKDTSSAVNKMYLKILATAGLSGDWAGSMKTYAEYVKRGFVPTPFIFQNLITSCKNASPPQVDRSIMVLSEMKIMGNLPTIRHYNSVIDTCRKGGAWRRGAQLFRR